MDRNVGEQRRDTLKMHKLINSRDKDISGNTVSPQFSQSISFSHTMIITLARMAWPRKQPRREVVTEMTPKDVDQKSYCTQ